MKKVLTFILSVFVIFAFIVTTAPDALAKNPGKDYHEKKLPGKVRGNPNGEAIDNPYVHTYWWNNNGSAMIEIFIGELNSSYSADIYKDGSYLDTLYPPQSEIGNDGNLALVNELRARIPINASGTYDIEIRINVTKDKKLYIEFSNQIYIPPIEAYFAGVVLNGDSINLKYNLYPLFEDVAEGDNVEVNIDGALAGIGQVVKGSWGQLEVSIPIISLDYYNMNIIGFRDTTLTVVETGVTTIIKAYYWPL
jgi:hypothetical protein